MAEIVVGEHQLCLVEVSADERTVVVSDEVGSLVKIDCQDIGNPQIKFKEKIEGIGVMSSLNL